MNLSMAAWQNDTHGRMEYRARTSAEHPCRLAALLLKPGQDRPMFKIKLRPEITAYESALLGVADLWCSKRVAEAERPKGAAVPAAPGITFAGQGVEKPGGDREAMAILYRGYPRAVGSTPTCAHDMKDNRRWKIDTVPKVIAVLGPTKPRWADTTTIPLRPTEKPGEPQNRSYPHDWYRKDRHGVGDRAAHRPI